MRFRSSPEHNPSAPNSAEGCQVSAQDAELLKNLYARFHGTLIRYFERRVREHVDTQDMAQEVFVRLLGRRPLSAIQRPEGYLFEIAASVLRDRARKRAVRHAQVHDSYDETLHAVEDASLERVSMDREALQAVVRALKELPERTRTIFILHRMEDLPQDEIARRLGISVSAVEKHMIKAVTYLMERAGVGPAGAL